MTSITADRLLLPHFLSEAEHQTLLHFAFTANYTTVRGPFRMAVLTRFHLKPVPSVQTWLEGGECYGTELYGAYIIRYGVGAQKEPHLDPTPRKGYAHDRLVCMLQTAQEGGTLMFDMGPHTAESWEPVPLGRRDAVQFRADLISHAIEPVTAGERIILTVGRLRREELCETP